MARWNSEFLDKMQYEADAVADDAVEDIVGSWESFWDETKYAKFDLLEEAIRALKSLDSNKAILDFDPTSTKSPLVGQALKNYLNKATQYPDWIEWDKIERAEQLFRESGVLSSVLFFCASLPEVYVVPDISSVLRSTGHLERATEQRIRSTATMILGVMLNGGIHRPESSGLAQIIRARFIHAVLRNLILRDHPTKSVENLGENQNVKEAGVIPPYRSETAPRSLFEITLNHGWKLGENGLPCNQDELAYTLLTFSYVFLRGLRRLGLSFSKADEEAYLHSWNVVGFLMGIRRDLMASTMEEAEVLFTLMQERARTQTIAMDPRPLLGAALINSIEKSILIPAFKPFAKIMIQAFTSPETAKDLGIDKTPLWARALFKAIQSSLLTTDRLIQSFGSSASGTRFIMRVTSFNLISKAMLDPNQPLELPGPLRETVNSMIHSWSEDPKAPHWLNQLEDRVTIQGSWLQKLKVPDAS